MNICINIALKAKVTREQTSDCSDSQRGSDEDGNRFERNNRFGNGANRIEDHFASECRKLKENKVFVGGAWSDSEEGNEPKNDTTCLMAIDSQEVCLKCDILPDNWIMDSGLTKHVTGNGRLFTLYKAYDGGHVTFGSNLKGKVVDGGNISHDSITITNVEHVSGLAFNLISVGQLCDDDCVVSFTKVDCTISKNDKILAKGHRRNRLYTCKMGDNSKQQICLTSVKNNSTLWHRRLGHAKMRESSYGGNFYTLMIVDDHSNYTWGVFVESKDDVLEKRPLQAHQIYIYDISLSPQHRALLD
ncbi:retrotransposon protein [Tanacetum coccineum]